MKFHYNLVATLGVSLAGLPAYAEPIPHSTGPYNVGLSSHLVPFEVHDPTSPGNVSVAYLVTLYYPTLDKEPCVPKPYLDPELAEIMGTGLGFNNVSQLTSTLRRDASFLPSSPGPMLIFGPGGTGPPTPVYTILLSELASQGYVVAALDHLSEHTFLRLPNGTASHGPGLDFAPDLAYMQALHEVRLQETLHFINYMPDLAASLGTTFQTDKIGAFGHSLGGSVALTAALESEAVSAAINIDGANQGQLAESPASDLRKPSLLLASEGHDTSVDASWARYLEWQSGWMRLVTVHDSTHLEYSDITWWKKFGSTRPLGSIDPQRMVDITRGYVTAFFDKHLLGKERPILDAAPSEWPEVELELIQG